MIQVGFLLLFCIAIVTAGAPASDNKPCVSTFKPATNFNATQFAGTWYQVRNIFSTPEREITCKKATYTANPDGTLKVELSWFDAQKVPQKRTGTVKNVGAKTDAKLAITIGKTPVTYTLFYLSYATFFGIYACIDNKADVRVFSKYQEVLDPALQDTVHTVMSSNGMDPNILTLTLQGC